MRYDLPPGPVGISGLRVALWAEDEATHTDRETVTALHGLADMMEEHGALVSRTAKSGFRAIEAYNLYLELLAALNSGFQTDDQVTQMQAEAAGLAAEDTST